MMADRNGDGPATQRFVDALRGRGSLPLHWPKEDGGQGQSSFERVVRAGASAYIVGSVGVNLAAPALMHIGSGQQKRDILPKIAGGEMATEPKAGSDLASLKTTALRDGGEDLVSGAQVFITLDMNSPGVAIRLFPLIDGGRHGVSSLDNVGILRANLIGKENRRGYHAAVTLDFERAAAGAVTRGEGDVKRLIACARAIERKGRRRSDDLETRRGLRTAYRDARITRALALRVLGSQANGQVARAETAALSLRSQLAETKSLIYGMYRLLSFPARPAPLRMAMASTARGAWQDAAPPVRLKFKRTSSPNAVLGCRVRRERGAR